MDLYDHEAGLQLKLKFCLTGVTNNNKNLSKFVPVKCNKTCLLSEQNPFWADPSFDNILSKPKFVLSADLVKFAPQTDFCSTLEICVSTKKYQKDV